MQMIKEVQGISGLFEIKKLKQLYYIGYGEKIAYMINLDTNEVTWKEVKNDR
jgi:hypothetical protein